MPSAWICALDGNVCFDRFVTCFAGVVTYVLAVCVACAAQGLLENVGSGKCYNPGSQRARTTDGGKMETCNRDKGFKGNTQYLW